MNAIKRAAPIVQLLLILPAALFMVSLVVRLFGPMQSEPAHTAQQVVQWYSGRMWTLWVLLTALPLAVLGIGCMILLGHAAEGVGLRRGLASMRTDRTTLSIATLTVVSAVILFIVAAHVMMN